MSPTPTTPASLPAAPRRRAIRLRGWLLFALGVLAAVSLVFEHGFEISARARDWLGRLDVVIAALFALELLLATALAPRWSALRERWWELVLLALFVLALVSLRVAESGTRGEALPGALPVRSLTKLYLIIVQAYLATTVLLRTVRDQARWLELALPPPLLLVGGFGLLVLVGTLLLLLPRASVHPDQPLGWLEALFTATSASCVTGLTVIDTGGDLSRLGQSIVMVLFQVGGLGIITFVAFGSILSGKSFSVPQTVALREAVSARTFADVRRQVLSIVLLALAIECAGALWLFCALPADFPLRAGRAFWAVFHAVSAFCNAGFGLEARSLEGLRGAAGVNCAVIALIVLGGLGAPVLRHLVRLARRLPQLRRPRRPRLPGPHRIQVRLSVAVTLALLGIGFVGFLALERRHALADATWGEAVLASLFQSVTPRTAGFNTVPMGELSNATLLLVVALMVVGASPVSTGGGIKTLTFGILLLSLRALMAGRERVEAFGRTLPRRAVMAALGVFVVYTLAAATTTFALTITDPHLPLRDVLFEAVSALSTVGLSTGITADLSSGGKLVLCAAMFVGRVGPLTLILSVFRSTGPTARYEYPEESVLVT